MGKIYHSETKSKTIIEHNLDNNEKKDINKEFVLQNVEHSFDTQNLLTNKKDKQEKQETETNLLKNDDVQNCNESNIQTKMKRNMHKKFIMREKILSKYKRLRQR